MNNIISELEQQAGLSTACGELSREILVLTNQVQTGQITKQDYQYLMEQIVQVKAANSLANDEVAVRFIYQAASALVSAIV
jgi:hypothetical protein